MAHNCSFARDLIALQSTPKMPEKVIGAPVRHMQVRVKDSSHSLGKVHAGVVNHVIVDLSVGVLFLSASRVAAREPRGDVAKRETKSTNEY